MSENLTPIKTFLGKYYTELLYSSTHDKYKESGLGTFFEQRFFIQNNKTQMVVDPSLSGLIASVSGNEIYVSKELYDHPNVIITNSVEYNQLVNPRSMYSADTFSTLAYLVCQNQTTFHVVGEIDEPIYIKYKADYETFYNSIITVEVDPSIEVEIVEEIESFSALNIVTNYVLRPFSTLKLTTFYQNHISALSFCYRSIEVQESASFTHILLGKGSSNIVDENKITVSSGSTTELLGIINANGKNFHSILYIVPTAPDYTISVKYKDVLSDKSNVSFYPVIIGQVPANDAATIEVSNITIEEIPPAQIRKEVAKYISDIIDRTVLERMTGVRRFYDNKTNFLHLI